MLPTGYTIPDQTLGSYIRNQRQEKGLSIRQMADAINATGQTNKVSAGLISEIENGRRFPSDTLFHSLAAVLEIEESTLKRFDQRMPADELKELAAINPQFGFAFRRAVQIIRDSGMSPSDMVQRLENPPNPHE